MSKNENKLSQPSNPDAIPVSPEMEDIDSDNLELSSSFQDLKADHGALKNLEDIKREQLEIGKKEEFGALTKMEKLKYFFSSRSGKEGLLKGASGRVIEEKLSKIDSEHGPGLLKDKKYNEARVRDMEELVKEYENAPEEERKKVFGENGEVYTKLIKSLEVEKSDREDAISAKQEALNGKTEKILAPVRDKKEQITTILQGFEENYKAARERIEVTQGEIALRKKFYDKALRAYGGDESKLADSELGREYRRLQANLEILKTTENGLRERIRCAKSDLSECDQFINRLEGIGKTPKELAQMRKGDSKEEGAATVASSENSIDAGPGSVDNSVYRERGVKEWAEFLIKSDDEFGKLSDSEKIDVINEINISVTSRSARGIITLDKGRMSVEDFNKIIEHFLSNTKVNKLSHYRNDAAGRVRLCEKIEALLNE